MLVNKLYALIPYMKFQYYMIFYYLKYSSLAWPYSVVYFIFYLQDHQAYLVNTIFQIETLEDQDILGGACLLNERLWESQTFSFD